MSFHGLEDLIRNQPDFAQRPELLRPAAILFGASRFLSHFVIHKPDRLERAVANLDHPVDRRWLEERVSADARTEDAESIMRFLRKLKKNALLRIALRDLLGRDDLAGIMSELSALGEVLIETAVQGAQQQLKQQYGDPTKDRFSVIALGKLGANELNFSSDVDLMYVYGHDGGETSGLLSASGVRRNRISSHEYYCKLGETIGRLLSSPTADGIAHRVDLRLRPEGSRGDLALSLPAYELYYESYGREWERAALLRARPVAGDPELGEEFLQTIDPFVFRRHLDFGTIDELRNMKLRIDSAARQQDIKRGTGGIREIEFFVQSFQLIYGGREPLLRERCTLRLLSLLHQKGYVAADEFHQFSDAYRFLRTVEHRLQMVHDLQTHTLPRARDEQEALARSTGFSDRESFEKALAEHRANVHRVYRELFLRKGEPDETETSPDAALLFGEELSDDEVCERLSVYDFEDTGKASRNLLAIRTGALFNQTVRTRRLLRSILPRAFECVKNSSDPDQSLDFLQSFLASIGANESYLSVLAEKTPLTEHLITLFAEAAYLSRLFVAHPGLLDALREQGVYGYRTLAALKRDLQVTIGHSPDWASALRLFKLMEEVRLGLLYLNGEVTITQLLRGLSKTAEAVLDETVRTVERGLTEEMARPAGSLAVIGLGKLGGRELCYGSDVDIIFIHSGEGQDFFTKLAERVVNLLSAYTKEGIAYKVDTRLRPTGTKGPLVHDFQASRRYYIEESELWERQTLLRARPVAGDLNLGSDFFWITREIVAMGAKEKDLAEEIRAMRNRIEAELSKDRGSAYDLKFGPGGLNELEFTIQYLQLKHVRERPRVVVPNTPLAIHRLKTFGFLPVAEATRMLAIYFFYREIDTMVRLMGLEGLPKKGIALVSLARKLRRASGDGLVGEFLSARQQIRDAWDRLVV